MQGCGRWNMSCCCMHNRSVPVFFSLWSKFFPTRLLEPLASFYHMVVTNRAHVKFLYSSYRLETAPRIRAPTVTLDILFNCYFYSFFQVFVFLRSNTVPTCKYLLYIYMGQLWRLAVPKISIRQRLPFTARFQSPRISNKQVQIFIKLIFLVGAFLFGALPEIDGTELNQPLRIYVTDRQKLYSTKFMKR